MAMAWRASPNSSSSLAYCVCVLLFMRSDGPANASSISLPSYPIPTHLDEELGADGGGALGQALLEQVPRPLQLVAAVPNVVESWCHIVSDMLITSQPTYDQPNKPFPTIPPDPHSPNAKRQTHRLTNLSRYVCQSGLTCGHPNDDTPRSYTRKASCLLVGWLVGLEVWCDAVCK